MSGSSRHEITQVLRELGAGAGSRMAADRVFHAVHGELRRLAAGLMRQEREDHTLQPTALVHEAYLRLVDDTVVEWENRAHFFGIAVRAMRQILIEHARRRDAAKRGGGWACRSRRPATSSFSIWKRRWRRWTSGWRVSWSCAFSVA